MAPLVRTGGSRHTGLAAPPHRNIQETAKEGEARGEERGKAEGIIDTCYDLGLPEEDILQRLQVKLDISLQAAQEYIRVFGKSTV